MCLNFKQSEKTPHPLTKGNWWGGEGYLQVGENFRGGNFRKK